MSYLGGGPGKVWMPPPGGSIGYDQLSPAAIAQLAATSGMRNRIINGDSRVAQRGGSNAGPLSQNVYGAPDRYCTANGTTAGNLALEPGVFTVNGVSTSAVQVRATVALGPMTGNGYSTGICQIIEGVNCYDLKGKQVTVSFDFISPVTGLYAVSLRDGAATQSCVKTFSYPGVNAAQHVTMTFPAIPLTAGVPNSNMPGLQICIGGLSTGTFQTPSADAWVAGNFLTVPGVVNWTTVAGNLIDVANLQLEGGAVATPFEHRPYALEQQMCQRYLRVIVANSGIISGQTNGLCVTWPIPTMRQAPSIISSLAAANYVGAVPDATHWAMILQGISFASITGGAMVVNYSSTPDCVQMQLQAATFAVVPSQLIAGSSNFMAAVAEL